ncbi:PREDICTED: LRR receptor [Prunus dulcis]|uniref:PREDICTED: LRR receptor n=1 Tax=Prunus dulcis TaxID=3755 RepID=A0A5E4FK94_PRUDU|nr:receptor-like protein EIX2 [Prunus dulcis]VVA27161.1 PREDICTED: LRR receptor [Prunus dulcis]
MSKLKTIAFGKNSLEGVISETHFSKLSKLQVLDLSSNSLVLDIHADWIPPFADRFFLVSWTCHLTTCLAKFPSRLSSKALIPLFMLEILNSVDLQGFDLSVYAGNPQLCGPPLKKMCGDQNVQTDLSNQEDDKDEVITLGFYISMGLGFAAEFLGVCGTLIFKRS